MRFFLRKPERKRRGRREKRRNERDRNNCVSKTISRKFI